jgi:hypothetical protein
VLYNTNLPVNAARADNLAVRIVAGQMIAVDVPPLPCWCTGRPIRDGEGCEDVSGLAAGSLRAATFRKATGLAADRTIGQQHDKCNNPKQASN